MKKILLYSTFLLIFLGMTDKLVAQEKGLFSIFVNFGGGTLEDQDATGTFDSTEYSGGSAKINPLKLGIGINLALPVGRIFRIGAMLELRMLFSNSEYTLNAIKISSSLNSTMSLGFAVGPYFRLALWGPGKSRGLGFAPYFLLNSLRGETKTGLTTNGSLYEWTDDPALGLGGGLMVDIYFLANFGVNLGLEFQYANLSSGFAAGASDGNSKASALGPVFYLGLIFSGGSSTALNE